MTLPSEREMHDAVRARDAGHDGVFWYGVVTTGVFCRPSCRSRRPRPENLRFFGDLPTAVVAGFRPCKRCRPLDEAPELAPLVRVARHIEERSEQSLTLAELGRVAGLSPSRLQRRFKQAFGVSPSVYRKAIRMAAFKAALRAGDDIAGALYSAGFGSPSRVYGEAARNIGMTPATYRQGGAGETIVYACRATALGDLMMAATARGICFVQFGDDEHALLAALRAEFPRAALTASRAAAAPELDAWIDALGAHLDAAGPRPDLPLDLRGTAFQILVWRFLLDVPAGDTVSYAELAAGIGRPKAVRAAASACAANRVAVLVPCHRVLRADGALGGYRWGSERKRALLGAELARRVQSARR